MPICPVCNKEFIQKNTVGPKRKYCSIQCHDKSRVKKPEDYQPCLQCGKPAKVKFCSKECRLTWQKITKRKPKITAKLICENCGNEFIPNHFSPGQKFCSRKCQLHTNGIKPKTHLTATCRYCGKEYHPKSIERNKYCSRKCRFNYLHERKAKRLQAVELEKQDRQPKYRKCSLCGKEYQFGKGYQGFCSHECRKEANRQRSCEYYKAHFISVKQTNPFITKSCPECGRSFKVNYHANRTIYCSKRCSEKEFKRNQNHKRRLNKVSLFISKVHRQEIFKRDNFTCQICHKKINLKYKFPHPLSATIDHIIPLAKGGTHEPKNCQTAHMICNSNKRDLLQGQLLLIG
jgi:endogenous inhibitor of DNA gyrase (YacG/DUF329 family)